jgi:hypothetical protein
MRHKRLARLILIGLIACGAVTGLAFDSMPRVLAQAPARTADPFSAQTPAGPLDEGSWLAVNLAKVKDAALALPIATLLGAALALRPRRRGTPKRSAPIVQTQIILALIGALVMLVVGSSLARAFGVVGAAGLVRYRARVQDPKDAGVMLSTLAVGLAAGVGLYFVAAFASAFIVGVLWIIESFEPEAVKFFILKIATKQAGDIQPKVEDLLRRHRAGYELRTSSEEELSYEVRLPSTRGTDRLSKSLLQIEAATAVDWDEEKKKQAEEIA